MPSPSNPNTSPPLPPVSVKLVMVCPELLTTPMSASSMPSNVVWGPDVVETEPSALNTISKLQSVALPVPPWMGEPATAWPFVCGQTPAYVNGVAFAEPARADSINPVVANPTNRRLRYIMRSIPRVRKHQTVGCRSRTRDRAQRPNFRAYHRATSVQGRGTLAWGD